MMTKVHVADSFVRKQSMDVDVKWTQKKVTFYATVEDKLEQ